MQVTPELTIKKILGESYYRKIRKWIEEIAQDTTYSLDIKPLTQKDLLDFIPFYEKIITTKHNNKIINLEQQYIGQIGNNSWLYFASLKKNNQFLAGAISRNKLLRGKNTMVGCVQVGSSEKINNVPCLYYMEYLFFQLWFDLKVACFSDGKDPNCYGFLGPNIGLAIHKLQKGYFPYSSSDIQITTIDTEKILVPTLLFLTEGLDIEQRCKEALIWRWTDSNDGIMNELSTLLRKRGIFHIFQ